MHLDRGCGDGGRRTADRDETPDAEEGDKDFLGYRVVRAETPEEIIMEEVMTDRPRMSESSVKVIDCEARSERPGKCAEVCDGSVQKGAASSKTAVYGVMRNRLPSPGIIEMNTAASVRRRVSVKHLHEARGRGYGLFEFQIGSDLLHLTLDVDCGSLWDNRLIARRAAFRSLQGAFAVTGERTLCHCQNQWKKGYGLRSTSFPSSRCRTNLSTHLWLWHL